MSYFIVDEKGHAADFATSGGMEDLDRDGRAVLQPFLETGRLTGEEAKKLADALRGDPKYGYISELLDSMSGEVILTNGLLEDDQPEAFAEDEEEEWYEADFSEDADEHEYAQQTTYEKRITPKDQKRRRKIKVVKRGGRSRGK